MGLSIKQMYVAKDTLNNTYDVEYEGVFSSGYTAGEAYMVRNGNTVELTLTVNPPNPNILYAQVMRKYVRTINMGHFAPGRYAVRINKNNNYVEWFQVQ